MPVQHSDPLGSFPAASRVVLVLIDVISDFEFEDAERLFPHARKASERIHALKGRARAAGVPVVYVNDNFGQWRSDFRAVVERCCDEAMRGKPIVDLLHPEEDDFFVLKPKHSGFFGTTLEVLLTYFGADTLILTGFSGDICVLFTANDAYMRDYRLFVPADCVASVEAEGNRYALDYMQRVLHVDTRSSDELDLEALKAETVAEEGG